MTVEEKAKQAFDAWYSSLKLHKAAGGPAKGTISVALQLLDSLKTEFNLDFEYYRAAGKAQIKRIGGENLKRVLAEFEEHRLFTAEGGRTNRGSPGAIEPLLTALRGKGLEDLPMSERVQVLTRFQAFLVEKVREYHARQRLKLAFDPSKSTWQMVSDLLATARETGKDGAVAQHLVGAKLQLRFPEERVQNNSTSTADQQLGRRGDFQIRDTCFHVTVASPMPALLDKCRSNLNDGLRVFLLVPNRVLPVARSGAEEAAPGKIAVECIESFVGQNVEELSVFSKHELLIRFKALLELYNKRVDEVELDRSLQVEIPPGLAPPAAARADRGD